MFLIYQQVNETSSPPIWIHSSSNTLPISLYYMDIVTLVYNDRKRNQINSYQCRNKVISARISRIEWTSSSILKKELEEHKNKNKTNFFFFYEKKKTNRFSSFWIETLSQQIRISIAP